MIEYKSIATDAPPLDTPLLVRGPDGHCIAKLVYHERTNSTYWIALVDGIEVELDSATYCPEPTEWAWLA